MRKVALKGSFFFVIIILLLSTTALAGPYRHKSRLEIKLGLANIDFDSEEEFYGEYDRRLSIDGNASFAIGYSHWLDDNTSIGIALGVLSYDEESWQEYGYVVDSEVAVMPLFVKLRYYPGHPRRYADIRPFVDFGLGPVFGFEKIEEIGDWVYTYERRQSVMGGYIGGGIDFLLGRRLMLGVGGGYYFMGDFKRPVGAHYNYSGAEFSVGFSVLFGR